MKSLKDVNLKNKIFFSTLFVIMMISAVIALLSRWILVSSLTSELELRGIAIAHSIAERGTGYILEKNQPMLLTLIFDEARLRERHHLIAYIFISDEKNRVICHTFTKPFPPMLQNINQITTEEIKSVKLVHLENQSAYDIAVPMKEGLYQIGTVHVGLSKEHIDNLVAKLRFTFLGFISLVIIIIFIISHWLARYITMPIDKLTKMSDELSRGNFDVVLDPWGQEMEWNVTECPSYEDSELSCWTPADTADEIPDPGIAGKSCRTCAYFKHSRGDEVIQLADSFKNMVYSIKFYRRKLRESEEKYRSLFYSGPDPILVVSTNTLQIIDANPRALEVYEYSKEEMKGMSFLELSEEHDGENTAIFNDIEKMSDGVYFPKMIHYKKGREPFFVSVHACPISYLDAPAIIISTTDITIMIEKDAQLIQASKMKTLGEMSAGIAHELNQPLNAIKMGSDYLSMAVEKDLSIKDDELKMVCDEISSQIDRASEIINTLRAFGRKADPIMEKTDINKSVAGVITILGRQFELQQIKFECDLAGELPSIMAQENRLQQVFFNLASNARDAINEKAKQYPNDVNRTIFFRTFYMNEKVYAEVTDKGMGIPDSVRNKIFEPFFTTKNTSRDMGLGLAITNSIVKDFNGDIAIESTSGVGTTFIMSFPAVA